VVVVYFCQSASALDPNRLTSQYVRQQWSTESGPTGGRVRTITQTADGYLWIGTDNGLVRFDGLNLRPVPFSSDGAFSNTPVLGLTKDTGGNLLVRLQGVGFLRQSNGKFESVTSGTSPIASHVTAMWSEPNGGVLISDLLGGLVRFRGEKLEVVARPGVLPQFSVVISLAETPDGTIWMGTLGAGLSYLANGRVTTVTLGLPYRKINCLLPISATELWVGTDEGLLRWDGSALSRIRLPTPGDLQVLTMLRDRDSNVWVGTAKGLLRINAAGVSLLEKKDSLGEEAVNALFEDREGNIWVGGARGIERIRDSAFITYAPAAALPSENFGPVYTDAENRTWFAPARGGLFWLSNGRVKPVGEAGLHEAGLEKDVVYSITGYKTGQENNIWVGRQHGGLTRLRYENGSFSSQTYTEREGLAQNSVYSVYRSPNGAVWAGTLNGGVSRFEVKDGRFVTYTTASGLSSNTIYSILETRDGVTWFATPNGLNSWSSASPPASSSASWRTFSSRDGLPSDNVNCLFEDSSGVLWIGTSAGLASLRAGHISVFPEAPDSLHQPVFGLAEDKRGHLWVATANHVLRVQHDNLLARTLEEGDVREYGLADGLRSTEGVNRNDSVASDSQGRIWFSTSRGLSLVDPSQRVGDSLPALVRLEGITADGRPIDIGSSIHIPPSHNRITFTYTGLSLAVPERVLFRYFVEGFDRAWSDPVAAREAVYTNLNPGSYKFHVIASNSDGIWNSAENTVAFEVEPAVWQTGWFRSLCVVAAALTILLLYRVRLHQLRRQLNLRFEERLAERTRIAQELHDTLLQGLQSASMQLHVANDLLPEQWTAKPLVIRVLDLMGQVIADGRNALRGLRSSGAESGDLEESLSRVPQEFVSQQVEFRVIVEGQTRPLHPVIRDEVYRIGHEALANAYRHSRAGNIEVELEYADDELRVLVRDNGCGIDPHVLQSGRDGHWGLSGIRERSDRIGAKVKVWSRPAGGTEVELSVPGRVAFQHYSSRSGLWWLKRWLNGSRPREAEPDVELGGIDREK